MVPNRTGGRNLARMGHDWQMPRLLLIAPADAYRIADFVEAARSLNCDVVIASDGARQIAATLGERYVEIDPARAQWSRDRILKAAAESPVDAIVSIDDRGVEIAALASAELSLPHNPPAAVAATRDKLEMRKAWRAGGVAQPAFAVAGPDEDPAVVAGTIGFPCVVKPIGLSASRGVIRADGAEALRTAAGRVRAILSAAGQDPEEPLLVEEYLPGEEIAVEGILIGGDLQVLAVLDKPDPLEGPFFEETLFVTPSRHPAGTLEAAIALCRQAAAALGLREGPVHAEVRLTPAGPRMLELAARSIGGLCGRALRFGLLGLTLETHLLRHALGYPSAITEPASAAAGVMMLPIPRAGRLEAVHGKTAALAVPGITGLDMTVQVGTELTPLPEGDRYLGFLFATGAAPDEVEASLREAYAALDVVIR